MPRKLSQPQLSRGLGLRAVRNPRGNCRHESLSGSVVGFPLDALQTATLPQRVHLVRGRAMRVNVFIKIHSYLEDRSKTSPEQRGNKTHEASWVTGIDKYTQKKVGESRCTVNTNHLDDKKD